MSNHTPGPWTVRSGFVYGKDGSPVAEVHATALQSEFKARLAANARLIAAAPEWPEPAKDAMAEIGALRLALSVRLTKCEDICNCDGCRAMDIPSAAPKLRAAIAKAEGSA